MLLLFLLIQGTTLTRVPLPNKKKKKKNRDDGTKSAANRKIILENEHVLAHYFNTTFITYVLVQDYTKSKASCERNI